MGSEIYDDSCKGCAYSRRTEEPCGGIIELPGNWILNHYGGNEGFLGWLALQPRYHRMELNDLNTDEAKAIGENVLNIDLALRQYWAIRFEKDPIWRVYVAYFFESAFEKSSDKYHLHIHLIPRTEKFRSLLTHVTKTKGIEKDECIQAWNIHQLSKHKDFPTDYRIQRNDEESKKKVEALMTYLKGQLHRVS